MKAVGITAEFNPLHKGHKYLLDSVRAKYPSHAVICVMSGNFVQRGGPAVCDKYTRAKYAVLCGADLVIELPVVYAVNSADNFAGGAMKIFRDLGCVETVAFGSETGDASYLMQIADKTEDEAFKKSIKEKLSLGASYSAAYSDSLGFDRIGSNDILGTEYIRQSAALGAGFDFFAVKRKGSNHDDDGFDPEGYSSAGHIRSELLAGDYNKVYVNLPDEADYNVEELKKNYSDVLNHYFDIVKYKILETSASEIADILEVKEGIENRFRTSVSSASSIDNLVLAIKSKRYTYASVSRMLTQLVLGIRKVDFIRYDEYPYSYGRILAFNTAGSRLLKDIRGCSCRLITNINKETDLDKEVSDMLRTDIKANDIYSHLAGMDMYKSSDHVRSPFILLT